MGYVYTNSGALCCDGCGASAGTKKRKCPHIVDGLPYCSPPALCKQCFDRLGGTQKIHAGCAEPAQKSREHWARIQAALDSGDYLLSGAWGDWHEKVPAGKVGMRFLNKSQASSWILLDAQEHNRLYHGERKEFLSDYASVAQEWTDHP